MLSELNLFIFFFLLFLIILYVRLPFARLDRCFRRTETTCARAFVSVRLFSFRTLRVLARVQTSEAK